MIDMLACERKPIGIFLTFYADGFVKLVGVLRLLIIDSGYRLCFQARSHVEIMPNIFEIKWNFRMFRPERIL